MNLDPWGPVYKVCRGRNVRESVSALRVNGVLYSTWSECAWILLEWFFPATGMVGDRMNEASNRQECESVRYFVWDEVNAAVRNARLRKAPGLDGITGEMLRMIWKAIPG